jgi:hypothetical protein
VASEAHHVSREVRGMACQQVLLGDRVTSQQPEQASDQQGLVANINEELALAVSLGLDSEVH